MKRFSFKTCTECHGDGSIKNYNPEWLKQRRKEMGFTLRELGKRIGFSAMYLCDIELGRRRCPEKLSNFLDDQP